MKLLIHRWDCHLDGQIQTLAQILNCGVSQINQDFLWLFTAGNNYFTSFSGGSGNNALFNSSGYAGTQINDAYLTSPVFDCSNLSEVKLSYGYFILSSAVGSIGSGFVEVFDGTSWGDYFRVL